MQAGASIRRGQSLNHCARNAVRELHEQIEQNDMELVLFFCSSNYDLDELAAEMNAAFPGVQVVGCTTAGEVGPSGMQLGSLTGMSFNHRSFHARSLCLHDLQHFNTHDCQWGIHALLHSLEQDAPFEDGWKSFAVLLIDGLSKREEVIARSLQSALEHIPLIGGSAGDDERYERACVFYDGSFASDRAAVIVISTKLDFETFKTQHFVATDERFVVTDADPENRIIREINGLPAAAEYARLVGMSIDELTFDSFTAYPVVVVINGTNYVRSILKVNPDLSLTLFCALETGVVLRLAKGADLVENLHQTFQAVCKKIGSVQAALVFPCNLRRREALQTQQTIKLGELHREIGSVGFSTYGEQYRGMHINQTLVGVAIAQERADD